MINVRMGRGCVDVLSFFPSIYLYCYRNKGQSESDELPIQLVCVIITFYRWLISQSSHTLTSMVIVLLPSSPAPGDDSTLQQFRLGDCNTIMKQLTSQHQTLAVDDRVE